MPYLVELNSSLGYVDSRYYGDVTVRDIRETNLQIVKFLDESSASKLPLLTDVTEVKNQPMQIGEIWNSSKQVAQHPKLKMWVIVGIHSPILKLIIDMLISLAKIPYRKFDSRQEALAFLTQAVSGKG